MKSGSSRALFVAAFLSLPGSVRAQETQSSPEPVGDAHEKMPAGYASASASTPAPAKPQPVAGIEHPAHVELLAKPGVAFYRYSPVGGDVTRLCLAPCTADLTGETHLSLSLDGRSPVEADEALDLAPGDVVEGEYASNASLRIGGWIVLGLGLPGSGAVIAAGAGASDNEVQTAAIIGGAACLVTSLTVGLVMALSGDGAHVFERPATTR